VLAPIIGPGALLEEGFLGPLLAHAFNGGHVRIVVEQLPNPDSDEGRFIAARLRLALDSPNLTLWQAAAGACSTGWKVSISQPARVFFIESDDKDPLGPNWLGANAAVFDPIGDAVRTEVLQEMEVLIAGCAPVNAHRLAPSPITTDPKAVAG
jgi:hypothetical protein